MESDEDTLLYDIGHVPGAVRIDWRSELNDPTVRDYITAERFAELMSEKGISNDDTVVIYGDKSNWWAAYTFWVFTLFGHKDVRLLNGGRDAWMAEERDTSFAVPDYPATSYAVPERNDAPHRALIAETRDKIGQVTLLDVREPAEYTGAASNASDYPDDPVCRTGHIPTAINVPWNATVHPNSRFRSREELDVLYQEHDPDAETIVYCRLGDRSAHSWFVLKYLLGFSNVRNYDGSWVEWGNMVGMPIARGSEPGHAPA